MNEWPEVDFGQCKIKVPGTNGLKLILGSAESKSWDERRNCTPEEIAQMDAIEVLERISVVSARLAGNLKAFEAQNTPKAKPQVNGLLRAILRRFVRSP